MNWRLLGGSARRRLGRAPRTRIAEFAEEPVARIDGIVRGIGEPLRAVLSLRPCVFFECVRLSDSEAPGATKRVVAGQDFLVEDETGIALVRYEEHAVATIPREPRSGPGAGREVPERSGRELAQLEALCGSNKAWRSFDEGYLFEEAVLCAGDRVSVLGHGAREPNPDPAAATGGYRDTATRLVLSGTERAPLIFGIGKQT